MPAGQGIQGMEALAASLDAAAHEVADLLAAHQEAGHLLESRAQTTSPRRTGYLASKHNAVVTAGRLEVVNSADYAAAVHARKPWLANTLNDLTEQLLEVYTRGVAQAVATIHGR